MSDTTNQIWEIIKIITAFVFGSLGVKIFDKLANKKTESLQQIKMLEEGSNLQIEVKTNIDRVVEAKTKELNIQIGDLKETIIHLSTRYRTDMDRYIDRMADLEAKFDDQIKRNTEMEDKLLKQIKIREECLSELEILKIRIHEIEKKTS